ncbi:tape measure protein, partial [Immundisolibacter sp.]|uniref:tape measure protein n=1 Tax=Immundisolibacter sp. TaxID=1934948 RepID=UPI003F852EA8
MTRLVREFTQASDTYTKLNSRIKLVTASAAEQAAVQQRLFESAQRTRTAYAGTAELYARVARNVGQLGVSQAEVLRLTESVNQAIQIGGATAQEAAGGVIQFTQAMSAGLGGEELRSVTENMPRLAEAIMRGLEAIGVGARVTLRELRALGEARELTPDRLFRAIMTQVDTLDGEFAQLERTVGQAMTQLSNDVQRAMARADMQPLIDGIDGVRDILSDPATLEAITFFGTRLAQSINLALIPVRELGRTIGWFINQFDLMKGEQGAIASGDPGKIQARIKWLQQQIDDHNQFGERFRGFRRTPEQLSALRAEIARLEASRQTLARDIAAGMPDLSLKPPPLPDIPQLSDAATQAATAQEKRLQQIKSIVAALEEENATLGMNAVALAEYELAALGAAPATIAYAKSLAAATEAALADVQAAEAAQRAREDLAAEIEQIAGETFAALMTQEASLRTAAARRQELVRQAVADQILAEERGAAIIAGIHEKLNRDLQRLAEDSTDAFTKFAEEAAANVQNVMADTLFNWMQGEFGNIEQDFKRMLDRMVANALAARLGEAL